tara:strand:- start:866 stop:1138 length:273 start_codon:yes stop_codon:yes gene_type:complete
MRFTRKKVLDAIGDPCLDLIQGKGYLYFEYDSNKAGTYIGGREFETHSVYVFRLNQLQFDRWVAIGTRFARECQEGSYDGREWQPAVYGD